MRTAVRTAARLATVSWKTLYTPSKAPRECLPGIFISSLVGTMTWQRSWFSQILYALAWAQVGMLSDYPPRTAWLLCEHFIRLCAVRAPSPLGTPSTLCAQYMWLAITCRVHRNTPAKNLLI